MTGASADRGAASPRSHDGGERMVFVDALRVFAIVLVIAFHAAQAYGPTGDARQVEDPANTDLLRPFFPWGAAFGMGLLFLLVGYFTPRSYDQKGVARIPGSHRRFPVRNPAYDPSASDRKSVPAGS